MTKSRLELFLFRAEHLFPNLEYVSAGWKKYLFGLHKAIFLFCWMFAPYFHRDCIPSSFLDVLFLIYQGYFE